MDTMKVAAMSRVAHIDIREEPVPVPGENEVLIRLSRVGVCGSDVHYYSDGRIGEATCELPFILGHEPSGIVAGLGINVDGLCEGQQVVVEPARPCGKCFQCRQGRQNICPNVRFLGTPPIDGAFREYICLSPECVYPVGDDFSLDTAALIEPLAVGLYAVNFSRMLLGDTVAVFGCGPIGLVTIACARLAGASRIFASEPIECRRKMAAALGADVTFNPETEDPVECIRNETGGGVDISFEACGEAETITHSIECTRAGARMMMIGIPPQDTMTLEPHRARKKELDIQIVRRSNHSVARSIRLIESGRLDIDRLITHRFPLEQLSQAIETVRNYSDGVIKAMIEM